MNNIIKEFEKLKRIIFIKEDRVVFSKNFTKKEYLYETLPVFDLLNGKVFPGEIISSPIQSDMAIDEREISVWVY